MAKLTIAERRELAFQIAEVFKGLERAHGRFVITGKREDDGKLEGRANTIRGPIAVEHWEEHLQGEMGVGVVPIMDDGNVYWGAIDIDVYPLDFNKINEKIDQHNLPLIVCRTKSGGAHLFIFGKEPLPAAVIRAKLMSYAALIGYPKVEIFPKQVRLAGKNDVGNWLNMPYFGCMGKTERYAIHKGKELSIQEFIALAKEKALSAEDLKTLNVKTEGVDFADGPPCLQTLAANGFPKGSRNSGLFAIGVYLRQKFPDDWEKEMDTHNQKFMDPPLQTKEVVLVTRSVGRKNYFYPCDKFPLNEHCSKELCKNRQFGIGDGSEDEMNVNIGGLVKLMTDPPLWIVDVNGIRMELETDDLMNQDRFRKKCLETIDELPNRVKPLAWENTIREKVRNAEKVEAPADANAEGRMWTLLDHFCTSIAQARTKDEMLMGKPWTQYDRTYFRGSDFQKFLDQQYFRGMSTKQIWSAIRKRGGEHHTYNLKGKCVQCWSVPVFEQQDSEFDVPKVEGEF